MTEPQNKKTLLQKLSSVFNRSAKPKPAPVAPEILKDKRVEKAIVTQRRRRFLRKLLITSVAAGAISAGTQYYPDSVSTPLDQYMAEKGHGTEFSSHFHASNIRVYDRGNPLYPFHLAGQGVKITWQGIDSNTETGPVGKALAKLFTTPSTYYSFLFKGAGDLIFPHPLDAYSIANNVPTDKREVMIRPPKDIDLADFVSDFGYISADTLVFKNNPRALEHALFEYTMIHEARHGDQNKNVITSLNEADADRYAFAVLEARGYKPALISEVRDIIVNSRTMASVLGGGTDHSTSISLMRPNQTAYNAYKDENALHRLHQILMDADNINKDKFPDGISRGSRFIYMAIAMQKQNIADKDPDMQMALGVFTKAALYFDTVTDGQILNKNIDLDKIDMGYLKQPYKPVEDKLKAPVTSKRPVPRPGA